MAARTKIATSCLSAQSALQLPTRYGVLGDFNGCGGSPSLQRLKLDAKGVCWGLVDKLMGTLHGYERVQDRMKVGAGRGDWTLRGRGHCFGFHFFKPDFGHWPFLAF